MHLLHRPSVRPAIAAVALVATIGLAACGSDSNDQPSDQPTTPGTEQMTDTTVAAMTRHHGGGDEQHHGRRHDRHDGGGDERHDATRWRGVAVDAGASARGGVAPGSAGLSARGVAQALDDRRVEVEVERLHVLLVLLVRARPDDHGRDAAASQHQAMRTAVGVVPSSAATLRTASTMAKSARRAAAHPHASPAGAAVGGRRFALLVLAREHAAAERAVDHRAETVPLAGGQESSSISRASRE